MRFFDYYEDFPCEMIAIKKWGSRLEKNLSFWKILFLFQIKSGFLGENGIITLHNLKEQRIYYR